MSYTTLFFGVDLDDLARIVKARDRSVLRQIQNAEPEKYECQYDDDGPTVGEALSQIIGGENLDPTKSHQFGYALRLLCQVRGEWLPDDDMIDC